MEIKRIEKFKEYCEVSMKFLWELTIGLVDVGFKVIFSFGSIAAIIILLKMYPGVGVTIAKPMFTIMKIMLKVFGAIAYVFLLFALIHLILHIYEFGKKLEKERAKKRAKFLDEVVNKLKKKLKK